MVQQHEHSPREQYAVRPVRGAIAEIVAISLVVLLAMFAIGLLARPSASLSDLIVHAPSVGAIVVDHIGWALGVYVPVLLGFYAIVIGGQLVAPPTVAARIRRRLGFVAEAMVAALTPATALVIAACIGDPRRTGVLVAVLPVAALTVFLAVQLGGFIVFEPALRLAGQQRRRKWARTRLGSLRWRSRRPFWLVFAANAIVAGIVSAIVTLSFYSRQQWGAALSIAAAYALLSLTVGALGTLGSVLRDTATDRFSRALGWVAVIAAYAIPIVTITSSATLKIPTTLGHAIIIVLSAVSTLMPCIANTPPFLLNWSLSGANTQLAARSTAKTYRASSRKVRELTPATPVKSLRARARIAWCAFTGHAQARAL